MNIPINAPDDATYDQLNEIGRNTILKMSIYDDVVGCYMFGLADECDIVPDWQIRKGLANAH